MWKASKQTRMSTMADLRCFADNPLCKCLMEGNAFIKHLQAYLGGGEGDDVLDVPPAEAGSDLQHEGHHSCRQGGCSRRASVALRTASPLQHGPVWCHLQTQMDWVDVLRSLKYLSGINSAEMVVLLAGGQTQTIVKRHSCIHKRSQRLIQHRLSKSWTGT